MSDALLYPRFALVPVYSALTDTPVVVLQGARQVGKSTLLEMVANERDTRILTMDDPPTRRLAEDDPLAVVNLHPSGLLALDEVQRMPGLILALKANVDRYRVPGRFLVTGSADLLHVKGVGDSLAGRAETVEMMPLSQGELARRSTPEDFVTWLMAGGADPTFTPLDPSAVIRGGFPEAHKRTPDRAQRWFESYIARLSDHDARELRDGGYADQLTKLVTYLASLGQAELVKAHLATHLGVAESTVDAYLRLARTMRLLCQYPSWNRTFHRRTVRRPKVGLCDTGLAAALVGFTSSMVTSPGGREYYGALVEQFVALELTKQQAWTHTPYSLFHFRDLGGHEVDVVIETRAGHLIAIEVKATTTPTDRHWSALTAFRARFPERSITGVLLHAGDTTATLHDWLHVLPITALWQHHTPPPSTGRSTS